MFKIEDGQGHTAHGGLAFAISYNSYNDEHAQSYPTSPNSDQETLETVQSLNCLQSAFPNRQCEGSIAESGSVVLDG